MCERVYSLLPFILKKETKKQIYFLALPKEMQEA